MPRFYFDWTAAKKAYEEDPAQTPWTPPVSLIIQLDVALGQILAKGIANVFQRLVLLGRAASASVKGMGLRLFGPDDDSSCVVTAIYAPRR